MSWRPDVVLNMHLVTAPGAVAIRRTLHVPYVQYVHGEELAARPRMARFALGQAAAAIAVGTQTERVASALAPCGLSIVRIPPGVKLPEPAEIVKATQPTVVTVSRLRERYKGHDVLVRAIALAAARVRGLRWTVVGDGWLAAYVRAQARAQGIEGVLDMRGSVDDAVRNRLLGSAHVFALLSRIAPGLGGWEGFGIAFLEASARGIPVVAGDEGGATDAVRHGRTGVLVDPRDHVAAAGAIIRLLRDPARAAELGAAGRRWAQSFDLQRTAERVQHVLERSAGATSG
jgi:phosphatidyl-myo-inositol dimannoside synthase